MPFYAVAKGRNVGIVKSWDQCKEYTSGYSGAVFKKFSSASEAQAFIDKNLSSAPLAPVPQSLHKPVSSYVRTSSSIPASPYEPALKKKSVSTALDASTSLTSATKSQSIYVDGACRGNGMKSTPDAGYGVYYGPDDSRNKAIPLSDVDDVKKHKPTNQRAELHALNHALTDIQKQEGNEKYKIYTDSLYAKKCVDEWGKKWLLKGWQTYLGGKIANVDIIKEAYHTFTKLNNEDNRVEIVHVRGHQGVPGNEAADRLANLGADRMKR